MGIGSFFRALFCISSVEEAPNTNTTKPSPKRPHSTRSSRFNHSLFSGNNTQQQPTNKRYSSRAETISVKSITARSYIDQENLKNDDFFRPVNTLNTYILEIENENLDFSKSVINEFNLGGMYNDLKAIPDIPHSRNKRALRNTKRSSPSKASKKSHKDPTEITHNYLPESRKANAFSVELPEFNIGLSDINNDIYPGKSPEPKSKQDPNITTINEVSGVLESQSRLLKKSTSQKANGHTSPNNHFYPKRNTVYNDTPNYIDHNLDFDTIKADILNSTSLNPQNTTSIPSEPKSIKILPHNYAENSIDLGTSAELPSNSSPLGYLANTPSNDTRTYSKSKNNSSNGNADNSSNTTNNNNLSYQNSKGSATPSVNSDSLIEMYSIPPTNNDTAFASLKINSLTTSPNRKSKYEIPFVNSINEYESFQYMQFNSKNFFSYSNNPSISKSSSTNSLETHLKPAAAPEASDNKKGLKSLNNSPPATLPVLPDNAEDVKQLLSSGRMNESDDFILDFMFLNNSSEAPEKNNVEPNNIESTSEKSHIVV
ncbi:hypothetical protein AYI69_g5124 [Smittium culicis]|uniref:Uncharacterized protein n=1 Tax=Smittium culicis TaxID=133412 RepID=A0A1R1Y808_9FUNG|nr:hypothetical protein AYI69_g5124 [Smittium culicis]